MRRLLSLSATSDPSVSGRLRNARYARGLVSSGASLEAIDNGVNQQTLVVQVGNEVPRTISINKGDDARTISDKINQAGAQVNSTAVTTSNVYIDGYGSFSFKISSSSAPDIEDVITVGATAGSQAASLAAEVNRGYSEHNISATIEVDDDGVEYVKMVQDDGYDIKIQDYVTTGNSSLDFDEDGLDELTGGMVGPRPLSVDRSRSTRRPRS